MRRILIWRPIVPGNELDIFGTTDYNEIHSQMNNQFGGNYPNWGNKLWFQGLYSAIDSGENEIYFRSNESDDQINNQYDMILYPMANIFGEEYQDVMRILAGAFQHIKIPVYVVACGVQADRYENLNSLIEKIGESSKQFIQAIYNTGGEFALRGNFSKAFFDRLGFPTAVVTGCPSMYQLGAKFQVPNTRAHQNELVPIVNGSLGCFSSILKQYPNSIYIDQGIYGAALYDPNFSQAFGNLRSQILYVHNYHRYAAKLLGENRIRMIVDMNDWYQYLKGSQFNYSFGSRIHGNIMSILAGIPATVIALDTRTREMAEFFDIPCCVSEPGRKFTSNEMLDLYEQADYTKFNNIFEEKFNLFAAFLREKKIVSQINDNNAFFDKPGKRDFELQVKNTQEFKEFSNQLEKKQFVLRVGSKLMDIKNRK